MSEKSEKNHMATKTNTTINGHDYFRITRTIGHKIVDGKRIPVKKQFLGRSKTEAERKYQEWKEEQIRKEYEQKIALDSATLGERAEDYIDNVLSVSQKYATGTKTRYEQVYRTYIEDTYLDDMVLQDIKALDIQKFYNSLDVSRQTLKAIHKFMSAFYKWAVLYGYALNVMDAVELPIKPDNSRHEGIIVWEDDEIQTILQNMDASVESSRPHRQYFLVYLLLYTGMRIGECLGLKYTDIRDDIIYVERQKYLTELKEPKYDSRRQIPMHEELKKAFEIHKAWHENEMKKNHYHTTFVFTTTTGKLYDSRNITTALNRFYDRIGVPRKNLHVYRATFCTNMCRCGTSLEVTSKLLGHKSLEVTAAHYALVRKDTEKDAIDRLHYSSEL